MRRSARIAEVRHEWDRYQAGDGRHAKLEDSLRKVIEIFSSKLK